MKKLRNLVVVATSIVLIGVACTTNTTTTTTIGNWVKRSAFDGNARMGAVSFVIGDTAYVATGYDGTIRYSDLWRYSPDLDQWSQRAIMPVNATPRNGGVGFTIGSKGYVATGYDGVNKLQDNWEYDPANNSWKQKANLPDPANGALGSGARYGAVGFGIGTKGYICSGFTGSHQKDLWEYDNNADAWTQKGSMPTSDKRQGAVAMVYNNVAYIVSGSNNGIMTSEMAMYDPAGNSGAGKWTKLRDIANISTDAYDDAYTSIVRSNAVGFVIGSNGYLATGQNGSNTVNVWEYNFKDDVWTAKTNFERSTRNSAVGFSVKGRGFVGLGTNSTYYYDNLDEFKPDETYNAND